jgi:hypothetical protein
VPAKPKVKQGKLTLSARCPLTNTCTIRVSLRRSGKTLASGAVTVAPGQSKRMALKFTKAAQASLKRRKLLDVRLTVAGYPGVVIRIR